MELWSICLASNELNATHTKMCNDCFLNANCICTHSFVLNGGKLRSMCWLHIQKMSQNHCDTIIIRFQRTHSEMHIHMHTHYRHTYVTQTWCNGLGTRRSCHAKMKIQAQRTELNVQSHTTMLYHSKNVIKSQDRKLLCQVTYSQPHANCPGLSEWYAYLTSWIGIYASHA